MLSGQAVQAQCDYEVTAVFQGPYCGIFGYSPVYANGINASGDIVGFIDVCLQGQLETFKAGADGTLVFLDPPDGYNSAAAWALNDLGDVAGSVAIPDEQVASLWGDDGTVVLGTLPGGNFSYSRGVNNLGQVVGRWGNLSFGPLHGFFWDDGVMLNLGDDLGTNSSHAEAINDDGTVVGWLAEFSIDTMRAYVWQGGSVTVLPPIPGGYTSEGNAINRQGWVVGSGRWTDPDTGELRRHAFVWKDGEMTNLGTFPGFLYSAATDINDAGIVVGDAWGGTGSTSFVWLNGVMYDLSGLIPDSAVVSPELTTGINNQGQIVGSGTHSDGAVVAYLLSPIPTVLGDLTCDGHVGVGDLEVLLEVWGPCPECPADLDDDGFVGTRDLLTLLANWG